MKRKLLGLASLITLATMTSYGQATSGANSRGGTGQPSGLPPGLQNREQLPPGLQNREQLPPGLERRIGTNTTGYGRLGAGTLGSGTLGGTAGTNTTDSTAAIPPAVGATGNVTNNYGGTLGSGTITQPGIAAGTSAVTNQGFGSTNSEAGLTPTSDEQRSSRVYNTNATSRTNYSRTSQITRDQAFTSQDQQLLVQVRRTVTPMLRSTVASTATDSPWLPVHFVIREKVVTIVGTVPSQEISQQIETRVEQISGVEEVINQLRVESAVGGSSGVEGDASSVGIERSTVTGASAGGTAASTNFLSTTNQFGSTATNRAQAGVQAGAGVTNQGGLQATSDRTNATNRVYGSTNRPSGLPPGLEKRDQLPPGLEKRDGLPPGLQRRQGTND